MNVFLSTIVMVAAWVVFFATPRDGTLNLVMNVVSFIVAFAVTLDALKAWGLLA